MKILHLLGERVDLGGILSVVRNLQEATRNQGVLHYTWVNEEYVETRQPALSYRFSRHVGAESSNHFQLLFWALRGFVELKRLLRKEHFDVLHAHTRCTFLVAILVARWLCRKVLFTNHTYGRRTRLYRLATRLNNFHTVVLSPNMARHYGLTSDPPRINIVSACCADAFFSSPLAQPEGSSGAHRPIRLIGLGNVVRWKKWNLVLEALQQLNAHEREQIEFHHWGTAPPDSDSKAYAAELSHFIRTHHLERCASFHGSTNSIADHLRDHDWFILPSTNEPCSVALIEALASGLPAIVSASGGNVDVILDGETGLFFRPDHSASLAERLRAIIHRQVVMAKPGQIRESVCTRSASSVAAQYVALYRHLAMRPSLASKSIDEKLADNVSGRNTSIP